MSWSSGGSPHAIREAPSDSPRRETPPPGTFHPRHSRRPQGARRLDRRRSPALPKRHIHNPVGSSAEVLYTRYGNNPNQVDIGKTLALLENADAALFLASGMGATALAHLAVLRPGDHLLASEWIYGGVHRLFREEFGKLGIDVSF